MRYTFGRTETDQYAEALTKWPKETVEDINPLNKDFESGEFLSDKDPYLSDICNPETKTKLKSGNNLKDDLSDDLIKKSIDIPNMCDSVRNSIEKDLSVLKEISQPLETDKLDQTDN